MLDYEEELLKKFKPSRVLKWMILKMRFIRKILTDMTRSVKAGNGVRRRRKIMVGINGIYEKDRISVKLLV